MQQSEIVEGVLKKYNGGDVELLTDFAEKILQQIPGSYWKLHDGKILESFVLDRFHTFLEIVLDSSKVTAKRWEPSGGSGGTSVLDVVVENTPFIIETILSFFSFRKTSLNLSIRFTMAHPDDSSTKKLSYSMYLLEPLDSKKALVVKESLKKSLEGVKVVTDDFFKNHDLIDAAITAFDESEGENENDTEAVNVLRWLKGNNFIFLGGIHVDSSGNSLREIGESGVGLLRESLGMQKCFFSYCEESVQEHVSIVPTNEMSYVHKFKHVLLVRVTPSSQEKYLFIGHFSSAAKWLEFSTVPIIRQKIDDLLKDRGYVENSYDYKYEYLLLHKFPIEEFFSLPFEVIHSVTSFLKSIPGHKMFDLHLEYSEAQHLLVAVIPLRADLFTKKLFHQVQLVFDEALGGKHVRPYTFEVETDWVVIHLYCNTENGRDIDRSRIEARIKDLCKSWEADVLEQIIAQTENEPLESDLDIYFSSLSSEYRSSVLPELAAIDFLFRTRFTTSQKQVEAFLHEQDESSFCLRIFSNYEITLSDVMPILNSFNFEVKNSEHFSIRSSVAGQSVKIKTFELYFPKTSNKEFAAIRDTVNDSLVAALRQISPVDPLNQLALTLGLPFRELNLLRAYKSLLLQCSGSLKKTSINNALIKYENLTKAMLDFFMEKFSPEKPYSSLEERVSVLEKRREEISGMLLEVSGIQDDKIIRSLFKLIDASLRTNYFISARTMYETTISIKLDSQKIDFIIEPKPFREIFVYDIDMEGIHLRGGKIARGGLRWSDRSDDFRTEVLGLMKTQMVKNTIIVPVGSKGGFVVKRNKANQDADLRELGVTCYKKFISGLLDITDNYDPDNREVRPSECVVYDEFDPYLVVAADKGTATFSDIANDISLNYDFWLKDAFASGGSNGYSHKEMGITARGAWECAKRHFREMDIDIQTQSISVVGIGDMAGDVFGNGMLLSKTINLVAAFNHLHIFIDPAPLEPEVAHEERKRIFDLGRSSWLDYSKELISRGGGIFKRDSKSIELSPEIKKICNTNRDQVNGEELIKLILKASVDMIFNGGIGTYIKASTETHPDVNDKANDSVRVDAADVHAKVIVEGGNLGITQMGRVEYEKHGGIINTDAIDNSAGVDTSDHEVNIKILIESLKANGKITSDEEGRVLLSQCKEYVEERVLGHNNQQSAVISMDMLNFKDDPTIFFDTLKTLESEGLLNRDEDQVPSDGEIEHIIQYTGMPRSIHSYIMGLEKIRLYNIISDSDITKEKVFQKFLFEYFPPQFHEPYRDEILAHRLSRDIIATFLVNRIINRGGLAFVHSLTYHSVASVEEVMKTYYFVYEILDAEDFRRRAIALENVIPAKVLYHMLIRSEKIIFKMVQWIFRQKGEKIVDFEKVQIYKEKIRHYFQEYFLFLAEISPKTYQYVFDEVEEFKAHNVPEDLAKESAYSIFLKPALGLIRISEETELTIRMVAESNIIIGERFHFHYIHSYLHSLSIKTEWDNACHSSLNYELYASQDTLVSKILQIPSNGKNSSNDEGTPLAKIYKFLGIKTVDKESESSGKCEEMRLNIIEKLEKFILEHAHHVQELDKNIEKLKGSSSTSLTPVVVIEKFIANLIT